MEYEHTLLIVESPEIARRINRLNIPYLSTFSTDGFLWWPELSSQGDGLILKARKEQNGVEKRRELKKLSAYAVKVICATDQDPAGEFIAWSIKRYLKRTCVHKSLTDLSKGGIFHLIQSSSTSQKRVEPNTLHGLLLLQKIDRKLPQDLLHALFDDLILFSEDYFPPVNLTDFISFTKHYLTEQCVTLPKLLIDMNELTNLSFETVYNELWNLFLHSKALITYPRTVSQGFYEVTWKSEQSESPEDKIALCLENLRPNFNNGAAHESIRVTDFTVHPDDTRKWLNRTQRAIYSYIHKHSHAVFYPDLREIEAEWRNRNNQQQSDLVSKLSPAKIYASAASYGLIRNSNIYKTLSYLYPVPQTLNMNHSSSSESRRKQFNELHEWLNHPTDHPKKRNELLKISEEILKRKML